MSIVKDLLLISFFLIIVFQYILLYKKAYNQRKYFIDVLSHDLRVSTIAQIRGLELLEKKLDAVDLVCEIKDSCKFTLEMINSLLNTFKYENGEQVLNYETFSLNDTISTVCRSLSKRSKEKDIEFLLKTNFQSYIKADKVGIQKLLANLVSTALANAQRKSPLYIITKNSKESVETSIIYQGKALSEEETKRMFSANPRFSTVGHGIKMQLCKKIIDFHKGKICVKTFGKNLNSFTFTLPNTNSKNLTKHLVLSGFKL